jgi:D-alanyl-D-alanine dipeptidase
MLVIGSIENWSSTTATLQVWQRSSSGWTRKGDAWPAVIGNAGAAWGIGLHGNGAPNREGPVKKEGDGKSPAGVFEIHGAYGVAEEAPKDTKLAYETTAHGDWQCVDDSSSDHYGEIVDRKQVPSDWQSHEEMLRDDALYAWVIDIGHNPDHVASKGSCIFFHVWNGKDSTTVGCTAMAEHDIVSLLRVLDPADHPLYVLLPLDDYKALAPVWGLPPLL